MLNVQSYGAVPGGDPVNNRSVFQQWLNDLGIQGGVGYIPGASVEYGITGTLSATFTKPTAIYGDGPGVTKLRETLAVDLLGISKTDHSYLSICGIEFQNNMPSNGIGLNVVYPFSASSTQTPPKFHDLSFRGLDVAYHNWAIAFRLENAWNANIRSLHIKGKDGILSPYGGDGFLAVQCMAPSLSKLRIYHVDDAIKGAGTGWSEGWNVSKFELVGVKNGIWLPAASTIAAGTSIHDGHINADNRCIYLGNRRMTRLHDLLLMKIPQASGRYWRGIDLDGCTDMAIHDVGFYGNPMAPGGNDCLVGNNCNRVISDGLMGSDFASVGSICIIQGSTANWQMGTRSLGTNCTGPANMASGGGNTGF